MIKTSPHTPLYLALYRKLRTKIETGEYVIGEKLPTELQIAEQYGVSQITSRHALDRLAEEGYIHRYAGKGSYIQSTAPSKAPSLSAAPLHSRTSHLIGVIMEGMQPAFGIEMLFGIEQQCAAAGYSIVLKFSYGDEERERTCIEELLEEGVTGIILMCVYSEVYNTTIMKLALEGFPILFLDRALNGLPIPYVGTHHYEAAMHITEMLINANHSHLALAMTEGSTTTSSADDRIQGYVQCCMDHALTCGSKRLLLAHEDLLSPVIDVRLENIRRTKAYLLENPETTAFVTLTAEIADIVIHALNEMKLQQFTIASFDGPCDLLNLPNELLYVQQDQKRIGQLAAIRLIEKINRQDIPLVSHVPYRIVRCPSAR